MQTIKCVVIGDGAVGKTSMLIAYTTGQFPPVYVPTVFDNFTTVVSVRSQPFALALFDTAGQEEYDRLRKLAYYNASIFLICYSVASPDSFENVKSKWVPEIAEYSPSTPILLVGTQIDLRESVTVIEDLAKRKQKPVSYEEGCNLAKELKVHKYVECSALTQEGLTNVFEEGILAATEHSSVRQQDKRKTCAIL